MWSAPCQGQLLRFPLCSLFFTDTPTTVIYTLSLHDALPIWNRSEKIGYQVTLVRVEGDRAISYEPFAEGWLRRGSVHPSDRKSTRLNSSHTVISYAVFCLKKKISQDVSGTSATDRIRRPSQR